MFAGSGQVFIYSGSVSGLRPNTPLRTWEFPSDVYGGLYGTAMASGDFNGDGYADLAVGAAAPTNEVSGVPKSGVVYLYYGSEDGLSRVSGQARLDQRNIIGEENVDGEYFGASIASVDFNNDGYDDLAIGAPEADAVTVGSGKAFIFLGSGAGIDSIGSSVFSLLRSEDQTRGDLFGWSLATGDFNDDGWSDLAVGAPGSKEASGFVSLFIANAGGLVSSPGGSVEAGPGSTLIGQGGLGINESNDGFGSSLATGDLDGDGRDELVVGAPREGPGDDPFSGYVSTSNVPEV